MPNSLKQGSRKILRRTKFSLFIFLEDISPFCGAADTLFLTSGTFERKCTRIGGARNQDRACNCPTVCDWCATEWAMLARLYHQVKIMIFVFAGRSNLTFIITEIWQIVRYFRDNNSYFQLGMFQTLRQTVLSQNLRGFFVKYFVMVWYNVQFQPDQIQIKQVSPVLSRSHTLNECNCEKVWVSIASKGNPYHWAWAS